MRIRGRGVRLMLAGATVLAALGCKARPAALTVTNAAALGPTFRALGDALVRAGVIPAFQQENAPSLEVVRGMTELGKVPDVLAVADVGLLDSLVVPRHSPWYLIFASNAMVLAYGPRSLFRADVARVPWYELLQRPGVRVGRSDPRVDQAAIAPFSPSSLPRSTTSDRAWPLPCFARCPIARYVARRRI